MSSVNTSKLTKTAIRSLAVQFIIQGDYREAASILWPWFEQNEQTDRIWNALAKHRYLCIMGHGSASKTFTVSIYYILDWICYCGSTATVITSDTMPSMDRRIWADFKTLWSKSKVDMNGIAQIVDSKHMIRTSINDGKNAIHAIAAESDDAQSKIQGLHTKRIRVAIDEADNPYSSSIWAAISNLGTSGDLRCVALANPSDRLSEFGQHCEPQDGWDSINPEVDDEWDSKLGWHVLRLDGMKSPNIKLGEDRYPYLLTNQGVKDIRDNKGAMSPEWWTYVRAWYPPEGVIKTIFTNTILNKCNQPILWYTTKQTIAACDPAFEGGDSCVLVIGYMGRLASNPDRTAIEVTEEIVIKRKDMDKTLAFDYADQIVAILKDRGVEPSRFAIDTTGTQGPFADIIAHSYGKDIMRVQFGGAASDRVVTNEDTSKASERYKNFVTELWFAAREWCRLGLVYLKQPSRDLKIQLEGRRYELKGKDSKSGREVVQAEPKKDMKGRGLTSPDHADAFCLLVQVARAFSLGFTPGSFKDSTPSARKRMKFKKASVFEANYGVPD